MDLSTDDTAKPEPAQPTPKAPVCEGICATCGNDPCLKAPTIDKMFDGLE